MSCDDREGRSEEGGGVIAATESVDSHTLRQRFRRSSVRDADQRLVFIVVGLFNTLVGFGFFALFQLLVGSRFGYMWSLLLAHVTSVLVAFAAHRNITFDVQGRVLGDLVRFESVYLVGLAVNAALLPLLVEVGRLDVLVAQACVTGVSAVLSWLGHSRLTFRRGRRT
jgi:putative flippase GtrA